MTAEAARAIARGELDEAADLLRRERKRRPLSALGFVCHAAVERAFADDLPSAEHLARLFAELYARLPLALLPRLARDFSDYGFRNHNGETLREIDALGLPETLPALAPALSMNRSGFQRAAALTVLARSSAPRDLATVALRTADYVIRLREDAWRILEASPVEHRLEALAILAQRRALFRARERAVRFLGAQPPSLLREGRVHPDPSVRQICAELSLDDDPLDVLGAMLAEPDPRVRRRAARRALREEHLADTLLPRLELDPAPDIRVQAVRYRARRGEPDDHGPLLRACFDPHREVRHQARVGLARRGAATDLRARARRVLEASTSSRDERVGALAVLADLGRREDRELVRLHARQPGRVGREADRTLEILDSL